MPLTPEIAATRLADWQAAQSELVRVEAKLCEAIVEYAPTRGDPPRQLIIEAERRRDAAHRLFDLATEALDAQSLVRTAVTNFGGLG